MLYPIQTKTRSIYSLNGIWQFKQGDHDPKTILGTDEFMAVPSSFNDVVVNNDKRLFVGDNWYERQVTMPRIEKGEEHELKKEKKLLFDLVWLRIKRMSMQMVY